MQNFKTIQTALFISYATQLGASEPISPPIDSCDTQRQLPALKKMRLAPIIEETSDFPCELPFTIGELKTHLAQSICGQDEAIDQLATAVHTHLLRQKINQSILNNPEEALAEGYITSKSKHILLTGQSGSGKTTILKSLRTFLQKYQAVPNLHLPIITQNHEEGKEDNSLKNTLVSAIYSDDYTLKEIEHAIVLIDDMDLQLFSQDSEKKMISESIQEVWCPFLEGANFQLKLTTEDTAINLTLNTENMLFIGTAAFKKQATANIPTHDRYDLEDSGFLPSFIETFQNPIHLAPFNRATLFKILSKKNSPYPKASTTVLKAGYNISLSFTYDALMAIAAEAAKHPRSVQQLAGILDTLTQTIIANPETTPGKTITVTQKTIQTLPLTKSRREKFDEKFPSYVS